MERCTCRVHVYARPRLAGRAAACNGAMGNPNAGRPSRRLVRSLWTLPRQFYGEGRVLGSHRGLPWFKLRQASEDPAWDAARSEPVFKAQRDPSGRQMTPPCLFRPLK